MLKQNVIKNKIITLKTNFRLYETNELKKKKTQYTDIVLVLFIPF